MTNPLLKIITTKLIQVEFKNEITLNRQAEIILNLCRENWHKNYEKYFKRELDKKMITQEIYDYYVKS